jgi:hypothetical protein
MKLHQIPERWATVWGVGWDFEVVEVPLWKPMSVAQFGGSECVGGHIDKFREVTEWVYTNPPASLTPPTKYPHWHDRNHYISDPLDRFAKMEINPKPVTVFDDPKAMEGKHGYARNWARGDMTKHEWAEAGIWV